MKDDCLKRSVSKGRVFHMSSIFILLLSVLPFFVAACGSGTPSYTTKKPWSEMSYDDKLEFMGVEVFGAMSKLFKAQDAARFKDFKCETCHGADAGKKKYKMPNGIFPIDPNNTSANDQSMVDFMKKKLMPELKKIMAKSGHTSLKCLTCHAKK